MYFNKQKSIQRQEEINNYFDAVYCINLKESTDRYHKFLKEYENLNHPNLLRYEAVKGEELNIEGWPGNLGSLGCRQSHINALKDGQSKNYRRFIVFEDDVIIPKSFKKKLTALLAEVGDDWDMLYFYVENHFIRPHKITNGLYRLNNTLGMVGIAYNARCISTVINKLEKDLRWVDSAIADTHTSLYVYAPEKSIVNHFKGYSTIEKKDVAYRHSFLKKIYAKLVKLRNWFSSHNLHNKL